MSVGGDEAGRTEYGPREWQVLNERVRMLTERCVYHGDRDAGDELEKILRPWIRKIAMRVGFHHLDDVVQALAAAGFTALAKAVERRVDMPLGYAVTSMRRSFLGELEKIVRNRAHELSVSEDFERSDACAQASFEELHVLDLIKRFKADQLRSGSRTDQMVAEVVEVSYLLDVPDSDACDVLSYTKAEKSTITQKIARQRLDPKSRLCRLAEQILDAPVRANRARPRRNKTEKEDQTDV